MKAKITDTGPGELNKILASLKGSVITVGLHAEEGEQQKKDYEIRQVKRKGKLEDKRVKVDQSETLAEVATKHELGIGVPRRSFIVDWVDENEPKLNDQLRAVALSAARQGRPASVGLLRFGAWAVGQIKRRIIAGIAPELSEQRKLEKALAGVARKDTPLISTAQLLSSLTHKEEDRKG